MSTIYHSKRCKTEESSKPINIQRSSRIKTASSTMKASIPLLSATTTFANFSQVQPNKSLGNNYLKAHHIKIALTSKLKSRSKLNTSNLSNQPEEDDENMSKYQMGKVIAKGISSVVYLAFDSNNNKYAIKRVIQTFNSKSQELNWLKDLRHPSLLRCLDYYYSTDRDIKYLHIVSEYFPDTLYSIIKNRLADKNSIPRYLYQVLLGLEYLQENCVVHGNITPHNILVNRKQQRAVIGDFGMARYQHQGITKAGNRYYRSPQIVFKAYGTTTQSDMWSFGCLMVEMLTGQPPFKSNSNTEHILQIIRKLGTPTQTQMNGINSYYPLKQYQMLPKLKKRQWKEFLNIGNQNALDLISQILLYDPKQRCTPSKALQHPYFSQIDPSEIIQLSDLKSSKRQSEYDKETRSPKTPMTRTNTSRFDSPVLSKLNSLTIRHMRQGSFPND